MEQSDLDKTKTDHIEKLLNRYSPDSYRKERLQNLIVEIFPDLRKPLTGVSNSYDIDIMRRDRRIGLRMVLDAALGLSDGLSIFSQHETKAKDIIEILGSKYTFKQLSDVIDELVNYGVNLQDESWLLPFNIMTREINNREELLDNVPSITKAIITSALKLDISHSDKFKTDLIGHAVYLFVDTNWRTISEKDREALVDSLRLDLLMNKSTTPYGSLLMSNMSVNEEAKELKRYISQKTLSSMRTKARKKFEDYYIKHDHDIIQESPDMAHYLIRGWDDLTSGSKQGTDMYREWLKNIHAKHPGFFLEDYIMTTYKGDLAFKNKSGSVFSPKDSISEDRLKLLLELVKHIKNSPNLSRHDKAAIRMVEEYKKRLKEEKKTNGPIDLSQ
jgi:hypothetical protein